MLLGKMNMEHMRKEFGKMIKLENTKYNTMFNETKPIDIFNLPCDIVEDTMINIVRYDVEKEDKFHWDNRDHYYEIRFSSAREDE